MDHKQAVELQLAVKYVLGELPPVQRDEYEDHYIDCPECAKDVYAAAALSDTAREVFRQEGREEAPAPVRDRARGGWLAWLRPAVGAPVFAALLIVVAYQNVVTIPQAKKDAASGAGQVLTSSFTFPKAQTRGGAQRGGEEMMAGGENAAEKEALKVRVQPDESFGIKFDFVPAKTLNSYICELQDESGQILLQKAVPGTSINHEVEIGIPGGLVKPGKYNLVFTGAPGANGQGTHDAVLRLSF